MRRLLLVVASGSALALLSPAGALAHGHHRHHHHHRGHKHGHRIVVLHSKAHVQHYGGADQTPPAGTPPATPPRPPVTHEPAGTVLSFTGGVLTIRLKDGSTVSGKVTEDTRIMCHPAPPASPPSPPENTPPPWSHGGDHQGVGGDDQGDGRRCTHGNHCGTEALVEGAVVQQAILRVDESGSVFMRIDLVS